MLPQSAMPTLIRHVEATTISIEPLVGRQGCADLLAFLSKVPDPRKRRGVRHAMSALLAVAGAAVLAGARSFTAIGEWTADASQQVLAALGCAATVVPAGTWRPMRLRCGGRLRPWTPMRSTTRSRPG